MKKKQRVMYKTVTYFTKTKRPHEVGVGYHHNYRLGCSFNSAQGARRFTAIATKHEIESAQKQLCRRLPKWGDTEPVRKLVEWYDNTKVITYYPNRHQRKHGITTDGIKR